MRRGWLELLFVPDKTTAAAAAASLQRKKKVESNQSRCMPFTLMSSVRQSLTSTHAASFFSMGHFAPRHTTDGRVSSVKGYCRSKNQQGKRVT
jgi:hypothetical protein